jgi:hypothetical protein
LVYFFGYPFSTRAASFEQLRGPILAFLSPNLKNRYHKRAFKKFKDPIQEGSHPHLLTCFCSV